MSLLVDSSESSKVPVAAASLAKAEVDKTLHCWSYGQTRHAKKECPSKQKQGHNMGNLKRKSIVHTKDFMKGRVIIHPSS